MKLSKLQRLHLLDHHQGFTLDSFEVYSIPRSPVELAFSMPTAFDQFVAPVNVWQLSTCHFNHYNIFLTKKKIALVLQTKFIKKKISKKTIYKTFITKIYITFIPLVFCWLPVFSSRTIAPEENLPQP